MDTPILSVMSGCGASVLGYLPDKQRIFCNNKSNNTLDNSI